MNAHTKRGFHYMLRRTLPPWKAEETIEEAVRFCRESRIGEVIWKIDVEEFAHALPELSRIEEYIPWLKEAKRRLAQIGVLTSINPWVTLHHEDRGVDLSEVFPEMEWMMDYTGVSARSCACPLSPAWQEWLMEAYQRYASAEPNILWVEDDFRNFNHWPVRYGCFCPSHLKAFSERIGVVMDRESLVQKILKPGPPDPIRAQWFDFLGDVMVDVAGKLARAVHTVCSETKLGLMTSHPWTHSVEGRKWEKLLRALSGPHEAVVRPSLGNYNEDGPHGLYYQSENMRRTMYCLPKPYRIAPELENFNYTRFSKSVAFTRAQIALSTLMKAPEITMNLFDHIGSPISIEPGYGEMLKTSKPFFDALTDRCRPEGVERGVRILHSDHAAEFTCLREDADYESLFPDDKGWMMPLQALGIPATFEASDVIAVTGQILRAFERKLPTLFSGGMLLDLSAAETLADMGYKDLLGATIRRTFPKRTISLSVEALTDPQFGGAEGRYMTLSSINTNERMAELVPGAGSRVISRLLNPDREPVMPGWVLSENRYGGRTAVCPYDLSKRVRKAFLSWVRKAQLKEVIAWLNRGKLSLFVEGGAYMIPYRVDYPDYTVIAVMNLSSDPWPYVRATLDMGDQAIQKVEYLKPDGTWTALDGTTLRSTGEETTVSLPVELGYLELAVFTFG